MSAREGVPSTYAYGPEADQAGELYLPERAHPPLLCLLHGGFWRSPYGRDQLRPLAADLAGRGFAVWNLSYRRVGAGGGWPATLEDVARGLDHVAELPVDVDLTRVTVVGHSAGGHLALWSAVRGRLPSWSLPVRVPVARVVGLAPVADLALAHALNLGDGAVEALLGGDPSAVPERYAATSPAALLPLGVPQLLLHGTDDATVPLAMTERYAAAARAAGDAVTWTALEGLDHMAFLDPVSPAHAALCAWLVD